MGRWETRNGFITNGPRDGAGTSRNEANEENIDRVKEIQLKTYAQVLAILQDIKRGLIKEEKRQLRKDMKKKSFLKTIKRRPVRHPDNPPPTK